MCLARESLIEGDGLLHQTASNTLKLESLSVFLCSKDSNKMSTGCVRIRRGSKVSIYKLRIIDVAIRNIYHISRTMFAM